MEKKNQKNIKSPIKAEIETGKKETEKKEEKKRNSNKKWNTKNSYSRFRNKNRK